jgi:hypothetical protein
MAFFSGLVNGFRRALDPARLSMSQALLAGDYGAAAEMAQRFRQLQAEHDRLRMRDSRKKPHKSKFDGPPASPDSTRQFEADFSPERSAESGRWSAEDRQLRDAGETPDFRGSNLHFTSAQDSFDRSEERRIARELARRRNGPIEDEFNRIRQTTEDANENASRNLKGVNGWGYVAQPGDQDVFARHLFAEAIGSPEDMPAIAATTLNRVRPRVGQSPGRPENHRTLAEILRWRNQYPYRPNENGNGPEGSRNYALYAHPERMTPEQRRARAYAQRVAALALAGKLSDPTGGSTFYFASHDYDGTPRTAPGDYQRMLGQGLLQPSRYRSPYPRIPGGPEERRPSYFFDHRDDIPRKR